MVTVVIVVYNAAKYLRYAIDSVMTQSYRDFEVIAVDDGSTDNTLKILNEYSDKPNFRIMEKDHSQNLGGNRNDAIKVAKGDLITFIDGDDIWEEDKLEVQIGYMKKYDMVCSNAISIDEKNGVISNPYIKKFNLDTEIRLADLIGENFIVVSSVMIKKTAIENSGYFEDGADTRAEDYVLWLSFLRKNVIGFINKPLLRYRLHSENWSNSKISDWLRLLQRTVDIRSEFLSNNNEKSVRVSAANGCIVSLLEMARVNRSAKHYCATSDNLKKILKLYKFRINAKYLKYLMGYFVMSILCFVKRSGKHTN